MHQKNIQHIIDAAESHIGMDILIISTTTDQQSAYWEKRIPAIVKPGATVIAVAEDWGAGAGNGLGTLYAIKQAREKLLKRNGKDILHSLEEGKSIAVFHTAGEGKRLSPLTLSELNHKSAVKLPARKDKHSTHLLTILEAVIKQSALFSDAMKGRVSVFWGDQLFIPSKEIKADSQSAILLFAKHLPQINLDTWREMGLENYGIAPFDLEEKRYLVEKITYDIFQALTDDQKIHPHKGIDVSMGCFSLSYAMTAALLKEFDQELCAKSTKMDTDTHFWMPLTLDEEVYFSTMGKKEIPIEAALPHYRRLMEFKQRYTTQTSHETLFKTIDIGKESYWWDFGSLANYYRNNLLLLEETLEGQAMRALYLIEPSMMTDEGSCLLNCKIKHFRGKNSVLAGVSAEDVNVKNSLLINTKASHIESCDSLIYNVQEKETLSIFSKGVRADLVLSGDSIHMHTGLSRDGKADWCLRLNSNTHSYEEISNLCKQESAQESPLNP